MGKSNNEWFDELYLENASKLIGFATHKLNDSEIAKELVHEAFVILLAKIDKMRSHSNPAGWLFLTLKNLILNEMRMVRRKREVPLNEAVVSTKDDAFPDTLSNTMPSNLSEEEKSLLIWFYEDGLSHKEMADRLGISEGACRTRLFRARDKYRKHVEKS